MRLQKNSEQKERLPQTLLFPTPIPLKSIPQPLPVLVPALTQPAWANLSFASIWTTASGAQSAVSKCEASAEGWVESLQVKKSKQEPEQRQGSKRTTGCWIPVQGAWCELGARVLLTFLWVLLFSLRNSNFRKGSLSSYRHLAPSW